MPAERARIAAILDELHAAERAGSDALARWAARCREPILAATLEVTSLRDAAHAQLAADRLRELGAEPTVEPNRNLLAFCRGLASDEMSDRSKLSMFLARFPTQPHDLFVDALQAVAGDDETSALLDAIRADERLSLHSLRALHEAPPAEVPTTLDPRVVATAVAFLDPLLAAERAAAEVYAAWAAATTAPGLRGGLRAIVARETTHARLALARLKALGAAPQRRLDDAARTAALEHFGGRVSSDVDKLDAILAHHRDEQSVAEPVRTAAAALERDPVTRALLDAIADEEIATIAWLRRYRATQR